MITLHITPQEVPLLKQTVEIQMDWYNEEVSSPYVWFWCEQVQKLDGKLYTMRELVIPHDFDDHKGLPILNFQKPIIRYLNRLLSQLKDDKAAESIARFVNLDKIKPLIHL